MAVTARYDAKAKKIRIEIDYDSGKDYPDNRPEGKSKVLETNGNSRKVEGAPEGIWFMAAVYEKKAKSKKGKAAEAAAEKPKKAKAKKEE